MRLFLSFFILSFSAFAQNRYAVKGFYTDSTKTTPVPYAMNWVERGTTLEGFYKDETMNESTPISIIQNGQTRIIQVDKRNITFITKIPTDALNVKTVPVSLTMMDQNKNLLSAALAQADFSLTLPQAQEEAPRSSSTSTTNQPCLEGFGGLAGYCGSYTGMVVEEQDTGNKCALVTNGNIPKLELNENGEIGVRVAPVSTLMPNPLHLVGRIPYSSTKTNVDVMTRVCRPLDGTTFKGDNCKRINVTGDFTTTATNGPHFFGTYSIVDETTNERCQYRFSLDRG